MIMHPDIGYKMDYSGFHCTWIDRSKLHVAKNKCLLDIFNAISSNIYTRTCILLKPSIKLWISFYQKGFKEVWDP